MVKCSAGCWEAEQHWGVSHIGTQGSEATHQGRPVMKRDLSGPFLLLLLSSTVSGLGSVVVKQYGYIENYYTWLEAQTYCRSSSYYTDLATIYTQSDSDGLEMQRYHAWIGLSLVSNASGASRWLWSDGTWNDYINIQDRGDYATDCAAVYYNNQEVRAYNCGDYYFFICYTLKGGGPQHAYTVIPQAMTWSEAQQYCMGNGYDDLANFEGYADMQSAVLPQDFPVWTGLYRDGKTWKWSTGISEYTHWGPNEPANSGDCVSISSLTKQMATQDCSAQLPFICIRDNLVMVTENKTWEGALEYCRALTSSLQSNIDSDLVSIQPGDYITVMMKAMEASTEKVWVGLRFLAGQWLWVNGADMSYTDLPLYPPEVQHCGVISQNGLGSLETADCVEERNFMCYRTW